MNNIDNLKNNLKNNQHYTLKGTMPTPTPPFNCAKCQKASYTHCCRKCMDLMNKEEDEIKKSTNIKPMKINDILKIKLKGDNPQDPKQGKQPINQWIKPQNQSKHYKITPQNNIGIVCNEASGVFGLDCDFYNKDGTPYDFANCKFCQVFGTPEEFIKRFNTFTQKTTNGGNHLLFQHQEGLKQSTNKELHIDTRGGDTNGYLVGYNSVVNGKKYTVELEQQIQPIPADLLEWLNTVYWSNENTSTTIKETKGKKRKETTAVKQHQNKKLDCIYNYNIIDSELIKLLKQLPKDYYTAPEKWLKFTSAMKQIGKKEIWDTLSKKYGGASYNQNENMKWWDSARNNHEDCHYFEHILKMCFYKENDEGKWVKKMNEFINMIKYKPQPAREHHPDQTINMDYLTGKKVNGKYENGFNFNQGNMIIESDTGTAKTSGFKNYMKKTNQKFISIVSRRILAVEQYNDFNKNLNGNVDYYENGFPDSCHQGYITCLDSILKLESWADGEIGERVVFLDEFNSLVEYMLSSPTMGDIRVDIIEFVIDEIFMKAKQIICVDADISDISMEFIKEIEKMRNDKFLYIVNEAKHSKGVPAQEYFSKRQIIEEAKKSNAFIFACDSKSEAIDIKKQLEEAQTEGEDEIVLIVARDDIPKAMEQYVNFTNIKKLIFSPKVIYGNDSVYPNGREVFAYYLEHTISPTAFLQQINRERSINKLHYCFEKKEWQKSKYRDTKSVVEEVVKLDKISLERFEFNGNVDYQKIFLDLATKLEYKKDAYNTNKYVHFQTMLPKRGFDIVIKQHKKTYKKSRKDQEDKDLRVEEWKQEVFNPQDALNSRLNEDFLKIDNVKDIEEFKHLFLDTGAVERHIMAMYYFLKEEEQIKLKIKVAKEYPLLKLEDMYCRLDTMISLMRECGYEKGEAMKIDKKGKETGMRTQINKIETVEITQDLTNKFNKLYHAFFERSKITYTAEDLNDEYKFKELCVDMIKGTCGGGFIRRQKITVSKNVRKTEYTFNNSLIELTKRIMNSNSSVKAQKRQQELLAQFAENEEVVEI